MVPKAPEPASPAASGASQHAAAVHVGPQQVVAVSPPAPVAAAPTQPQGLVLPLNIVSHSDVGRCLREVEAIEDFFHQAALRGGSKDQPVPTQSQTLENMVVANQLNLVHAEDRQKLLLFLRTVKEKAPVVHMSFPTDPNGEFMMRVIEWFRREIHPLVVIHVGLQPALAAGCTVRTTNKVFDFSFRKRFEKSKVKLLAALEANA